MFKEDSQMDFAEENILLNVSFSPYQPLPVRSILKPIISLKCVLLAVKDDRETSPYRSIW